MKRVMVFSVTSGQVVCFQLLDMADYTHEELDIKLSEILDSQYTLWNMSEKQCKDLVKYVRQQGFYYSHRMKSRFFGAVGSPPGTTLTTVL